MRGGERRHMRQVHKAKNHCKCFGVNYLSSWYIHAFSFPFVLHSLAQLSQFQALRRGLVAACCEARFVFVSTKHHIPCRKKSSSLCSSDIYPSLHSSPGHAWITLSKPQLQMIRDAQQPTDVKTQFFPFLHIHFKRHSAINACLICNIVSLFSYKTCPLP